MNNQHAEQVRAMREQVAAAIVSLGWTALNSTAVAEKSFATAVGSKVAHVYLKDFGQQSKAFILGGDYQSEGRNILESRCVLIARDAGAEEVRRLVAQFVAGAEQAVSESYAVRLMRARLAA